MTGRRLPSRAQHGTEKPGEAILDREDAKSAADVAVIGTERDIERAITRLANAGATHFVANPVMFTTPEEPDRTVALLGSL